MSNFTAHKDNQRLIELVYNSRGFSFNFVIAVSSARDTCLRCRFGKQGSGKLRFAGVLVQSEPKEKWKV